MKEFRSENIHVYNQYGLTECPAVAYADRDQGDILNVIEDGLIAEAAPFDDKTSELVITDLNNTSMPIIRYNTHDQIIILEKNGIFVKKFKLVGRTDDLTKIRGKLVPKNDLREVILAYTQEFYIEIVIENDSDCLLVHLPKELKEMESKIQEDFKNKFKLRVNLVFEEKVNPPRTVSNKMIYIVDRRK